MNVLSTGVGGQLGHDVVNELLSRCHEAVGSDIHETYSGISDGSAVTTAPYIQLDITNESAVKETIKAIHLWTQRKMRINVLSFTQSMLLELSISQKQRNT